MGAGVRGRLSVPRVADAVLASVRARSRRRRASPAPSRHGPIAVKRPSDRHQLYCAIADIAIVPLLKILDTPSRAEPDEPARVRLEALALSGTLVPVVIVPWNESLERTWRSAVLDGIQSDARWCFCSNAVSFRVIDGHHTWSRHYVELDLALASREGPARTMLWSLARAEAMSAPVTVLERASELSARHGAAVCKALGDGVLHALELLIAALASTGRHSARESARHGALVLFDQSLTVLYRILFLLFAEARGLVPMWHPVYRDRYSIEAIVTTLLAGRPCRGIWQAVAAISRLAHAGCSAGELKVTPFNGRLFSPIRSAAFESHPHRRPGDGRGHHGGRHDGLRRRTGANFLPGPGCRTAWRRIRTRPRLRTCGPHTFPPDPHRRCSAIHRLLLHPSPCHGVSGPPFARPAGSESNRRAKSMQLRILDPAMGSGAFLVAACRFLASAVEERLVVEGRMARRRRRRV